MSLPKEQPRLYHHRALDQIAWVSRLLWIMPETYAVRPFDEAFHASWLSPKSLERDWWQIPLPYRTERERAVFIRTLRSGDVVQMAEVNAIIRERAVPVAYVAGIDRPAESTPEKPLWTLRLRDLCTDRAWAHDAFDFVPASPEAEAAWKRHQKEVA